MKKFNLLNEKEQKVLSRTFFKTLQTILIHTIEYDEDLKVNGFIKMIFEDNLVVVITTGKFADNISIFEDHDFGKEENRYLAQNNVKIKVSSLDYFDNQKLINVDCKQKTDEEYYGEIQFFFENGILKITGLIDELEFSVQEYSTI